MDKRDRFFEQRLQANTVAITRWQSFWSHFTQGNWLKGRKRYILQEIRRFVPAVVLRAAGWGLRRNEVLYGESW